MYSFVPHSHVISILLMLPLWMKCVFWVSLDYFLHLENLVWVLLSIMSFCVSDKFVWSSGSWIEKNLYDICCLSNPFDMMVYPFSIILWWRLYISEFWLFNISLLSFDLYHGIILNAIHPSNMFPFCGSIMAGFLREILI